MVSEEEGGSSSGGGGGGDEKEDQKEQQELDWKTDDEFKKFMGNPSIEAAIKLEKKRADRKLRELDQEAESNPIVGFFKKAARYSLAKEKERLEKAEEAFKALDLNKVTYLFSSKNFSYFGLLASVNSMLSVFVIQDL